MGNIRINKEILEYNNIIYINSKNGSDLNGNGSSGKPYKTISKAIFNISEGDAIFINEGEYSCNFFKLAFIDAYGVDFIGEGIESKIYITSNFNFQNYYSRNEMGIKNDFYNLNFIIEINYDMLVDTSDIGSDEILEVGFYNCGFQDYTGTGDIFAWNRGIEHTLNKCEYINCSFDITQDLLLGNLDYQANEFLIKNCVNTYHQYTSKDKPNIITSLTDITLDSEYNMLSLGWENKGTGINPDGSQAHLGIYGGLFSWYDWFEYHYLVQDGSNIKTYDFNNSQWNVLGTNIRKDMFINNGLKKEDLNNLIKLKSNNYTISDTSPINEGKVFSYQLDRSQFNYINNIDINNILNERIIDFEDGNLNDWVILSDYLKIYDSQSYEGNYSIGAEKDSLPVEDLGYIIPNGLKDGCQLDEFEYYYKEVSSSHGGGISLINSNGNRELYAGTDNPQWEVIHQNGTTQVGTGGTYGTWMKVNINFDWDNKTFTITYTRTSDNMSSSQTFDLINGKDIEKIVISNYNGSSTGSGTDFNMWIDNIKVVGSFKNILINDNGDIKTYNFDNHQWEFITTKGNESKSDFINKGIKHNIPFNKIKQLNSNPEILCWILDDNINEIELNIDDNINKFNLLNNNPKILSWSTKLNNTQLEINALSNDQLILSNDNINLNDVNDINYFNLSIEKDYINDIRIIISIDNGSTWKYLNSDSWLNINPIKQEVKEKGIKIEEFNNISKQQWGNLLQDSNGIRFGYYINQNSNNTNAKIGSLTLQGNLEGYWKHALKGTEYDYKYSFNNKITINIMSDGSYKINY
jgi:hypothetical protein